MRAARLFIEKGELAAGPGVPAGQSIQVPGDRCWNPLSSGRHLPKSRVSPVASWESGEMKDGPPGVAGSRKGLVQGHRASHALVSVEHEDADACFSTATKAAEHKGPGFFGEGPESLAWRRYFSAGNAIVGTKGNRAARDNSGL